MIGCHVARDYAHTVICQIITIDNRFSSFSELEALLKVRVRVGIRLGLVISESLIAHCRQAIPENMCAGCRKVIQNVFIIWRYICQIAKNSFISKNRTKW